MNMYDQEHKFFIGEKVRVKTEKLKSTSAQELAGLVGTITYASHEYQYVHLDIEITRNGYGKGGLHYAEIELINKPSFIGRLIRKYKKVK